MEIEILLEEIYALQHSEDFECRSIGNALDGALQSGHILAFDDSIPTRSTQGGAWGFLGGDNHPPNSVNDPYAGQIHLGIRNRDTEDWLETARHEGAHQTGTTAETTPNPSNTTQMGAEQIATYCRSH
ncbi:MAG: hypothetical protein HYX65_03735 [Gemmatimonadetes bacterium]|nr:hypothetical protein [Gemmatimonadota bacterium]